MKWAKSDYCCTPNWCAMLPNGIRLVVTLDGRDATVSLLDGDGSVAIWHSALPTRRVRDAQVWAEATFSGWAKAAIRVVEGGQK